MNPCQGHAMQQLIDECEEFLNERYIGQNLVYDKFISMPVIDGASYSWLCIFKNKETNKKVLVSNIEGELQTVNRAVLENIQTQLNTTVKELKQVLKDI